jgi:predicted DNA binding CopG/RHH family protein
MPMKKKLPEFQNEEQEREFWSTHDSTDYVDWSRAKKVVLPKLKPSLRTISVRLPETMIEELKVLANKQDVPYQSLLKTYLAERIRAESSQLAVKTEGLTLPEAGYSR